MNEGVAASSSWPFQVNLLAAEDPTFKSVVPEEGATGWADTTMMHVDAPNPNCAYLWMEWSLDPKVQGDLAAWFGSVPAVLAACEGNELLGAEGCQTTASTTSSRSRSGRRRRRTASTTTTRRSACRTTSGSRTTSPSSAAVDPTRRTPAMRAIGRWGPGAGSTSASSAPGRAAAVSVGGRAHDRTTLDLVGARRASSTATRTRRPPAAAGPGRCGSASCTSGRSGRWSSTASGGSRSSRASSSASSATSTYAELLSPANLDIILRTTVMAAAVTVACAVMAFPLAYYMVRYATPRMKTVLYLAVLMPLWSSYLVRALAWRADPRRRGHHLLGARARLGLDGVVRTAARRAGRGRALARPVVPRHVHGLRLPVAAVHGAADRRRARAGPDRRTSRRRRTWARDPGGRSARSCCPSPCRA